MMSVVSAQSGTCSRIIATRSRYRSRLYVRRMAFSTRLEPDWSGRWMLAERRELGVGSDHVLAHVLRCGLV